MITSDITMATIGGLLIGLAAISLMWLNGRIAGISGILRGAISLSFRQSGWRIAFLAGLLLGGFGWQWFTGVPLVEREDFPVWLTILAGLLVGFGTGLGSGCTSGHGICGMARLSPRSIVATVVFVAVGMATASLLAGALT